MITHRSWFVLIKVSGESGGVERTAARQESITTLKKKKEQITRETHMSYQMQNGAQVGIKNHT